MMKKNRWVACLCVCVLLCCVLCACGDVKPTVSEPNSAPTTMSTTTSKSITTTTTATTTTETTDTTTTTTTETRSSAITSTTTAKPVPVDKYPPANRQKCYVNYLGERVLVTFKEAYWSGDVVHWRYVGQLSDGYTLTCNVDMTTQMAQSFGVNYTMAYGLVDINNACASTISLLAKMGLVYTREELSYIVIGHKVPHGEPRTNHISISTKSNDSINVQMRWYNTSVGDQLTGLSFLNEGYSVEWLS